MESVKSKIHQEENNLKDLKASFNELMKKLKSETKEHLFAEAIVEKARRLMCFYFGEYVSYYDLDHKRFGYNYKVREGSKWSESKKGFVKTDDCIITDDFGNRIGFICELNEIFTVMYSEETFGAWCWFCKEKKYKNSLEMFITDCKSNKLDFLEIYNNYLGRKERTNHIFEIINEPSLKLKNMVLCITKLK
jgi:hypothetical protein